MIETKQITIKRIEKEDWKLLASQAHESVFDETWDADLERHDYVLVTVDEDNTLIQYATIHEADRDSAWLQYGGSFPKYRGSISALQSFKTILKYLFEKYLYVSFYTENTNAPMLKFGIKEGFLIIGARIFKGKLMLEHIKMREI